MKLPDTLIPSAGPETGNYYCTWRAQAVVIHNDAYASVLHRAQTADTMCEEFLFGDTVGILNGIAPQIRPDLLVILDDGWDVPYDLKPSGRDGGNADYHRYGSMIADPERFPSCAGLDPAGRLAYLSDRVRALGYRGLGLWIAVQNAGDGFLDAKSAVPYWRERFRWCREAGIRYLKCDWGAYSHDLSYRRMMTDVAAEEAPGLRLEHAYPPGCFDPRASARGTEAYQRRLAANADLLACSDFFRVYDSSPQFRHTTTLARAAEALRSVSGDPSSARAVLNLEDCVLAAAALGCSFGAMRNQAVESEPGNRYAELVSPLVTPENDLIRAARWHRVAPPWPVNGGSFAVSERLLTDAYLYPHSDENPWPHMSDKLMLQDCAAAIARGTVLPEVSAPLDEPPVTVCALHPVTGAFSIFTAPRTLGGSFTLSIRADVTAQAGSSSAPVGIFGRYASLTLVFRDPVEGKRILAQDLCADAPVDITDAVRAEGNCLTIPGSLVDRIGLSVCTGDSELPGLVLQAF